MVFLQCSAVESRAAAVFVPHRTAPCPKNVHAVFQLFFTTVNCCRGVVVPHPTHTSMCGRVLLRARPFGHRSESCAVITLACLSRGSFFCTSRRSSEGRASCCTQKFSRDTFTCCTALRLLRCCRHLQHQCGCIVAAAMRCEFSSVSAASARRSERATVHLLEWHE